MWANDWDVNDGYCSKFFNFNINYNYYGGSSYTHCGTSDIYGYGLQYWHISDKVRLLLIIINFFIIINKE